MILPCGTILEACRIQIPKQGSLEYSALAWGVLTVLL